MEAEGSTPCSEDPSNRPYLNHMNAIHSIKPYFLKIRFNTVACMSDYRRGLDW
jgi:hypothetical protein